MSEPLFAGYTPPQPPAHTDPALSADRRRTLRQADDIANGRHPLTRGPLHPDARRDASKADPRSLPFTCGTCVHRELLLHNDGTYPKCVAHDRRYVARSATSDVRAWWPACGEYYPTEAIREAIEAVAGEL